MSNEHSFPSFLLVIDVEATCDENARLVARHEMEIIEIGGVLLDTTTFETVAEVATFVRPVRRPILTRFCKELTTITQADVEKAPRFPEAITLVRDVIVNHGGPSDVLFASWGDYDRNQFVQDARFHRVSLPFGTQHLNLKREFSERFGITKKLGMSQALSRAGLKPKGTHHRGIDDARNIARLAPFILRGRAPCHEL